MVVHGDDFTLLGNDENLKWCQEEVMKRYDIKVCGRQGPGPDDDKSIRILRRCVEWSRNCVAYEADPCHAEIAIRTLGLERAKTVATPGVKHEVTQDENVSLLNSEHGTIYRRVAARYNFIAQDRVNI